MLASVLPLPGCDIRYGDSGGDGLPVVLSHGAGADHAMFEEQADHLRALGYRVILWDLRGHGASRPAAAPFGAERALADLAALVDHLGLDRPVLVGQSLGGLLSQAFIRRHPDRCRALIVIGSSWTTEPLSATERLLLRLSTALLAAIPAKRLLNVMADAAAMTPAARADAHRAFSQIPKQEFLGIWRAIPTLLDPDPGYRTPVPLCLIRGGSDRTGNISATMPRWARAEGVTEIVIPGAGHIANQDAPDEVNAAIETFLRSLPSDRHD